jgi:hypothetical protein
MGILRDKNIWMRASSCMNDVSEVRYGLERLWKTYRESNAGKQFRSVLNGIFPGSIEEIEKRFNGWTPELFTNTFLTCFSEHRDEEDYHGRLSMWRAYGKAAGIALVIKNSVLLEPADGLGAYSSPVAYLNDRQFEERFAQVTENVSSETEFLRTKERKKSLIVSLTCSGSRLSRRNIPHSRRRRSGGSCTRLVWRNHDGSRMKLLLLMESLSWFTSFLWRISPRLVLSHEFLTCWTEL